MVQGDGAVIVSCDEKPGDDLIWFGWQLYRLQAFELFRGSVSAGRAAAAIEKVFREHHGQRDQ